MLELVEEQIISANADGPRDTASSPIEHIALHTMTELDVECTHHTTTSTAVGLYFLSISITKVDNNKSDLHLTQGQWKSCHSMTR